MKSTQRVSRMGETGMETNYVGRVTWQDIKYKWTTGWREGQYK